MPVAGPGQIALKWPNDVLLEGDKLAGILIETAWEHGARERGRDRHRHEREGRRRTRREDRRAERRRAAAGARGTAPTALQRALPNANLTDTLAAELNALDPALQRFGAEGFRALPCALERGARIRGPRGRAARARPKSRAAWLRASMNAVSCCWTRLRDGRASRPATCRCVSPTVPHDARRALSLIDAGNSRVKWVMVAADGAQIAAGALAHGDGDSPPWSTLPAPGGAWLSNVAGDAVAARIAELVHTQWPGLPLTTIRARERQCGVTNSYTTPHALGSDRWAGMIGAHAAFPGEHLLIATFGTATTLEALRADSCFVGGLIAPGWSLMMRSLGEHTAQLPTLDADAARDLLDDDARGTRDAARRGPSFATDTPRSLSAGCTPRASGSRRTDVARLAG